jgi:hypothetical protein
LRAAPASCAHRRGRRIAEAHHGDALDTDVSRPHRRSTSMTPPTAAPDPALSDFEPLRRGELLLLHAWRNGEIARVGLRRPVVPHVDVTVRGAFVRHLAQSGAGRNDARRLQIVGAWIEGRVDLRDCVVADSLWFFRCVLDTTPRFERARVDGSVSFPDCLLPGLRAEGSAIAGDLALNAGCTIRSDVRLAGATIGRDLNCERLRLRSSERAQSLPRQRLRADGARISGDVILAGGFEADGDVRLVGAQIAGSVRVDHARLAGNLDDEGVRSEALNLELARVAGDVSLDRGFMAAGPVRLSGARIDGNLNCTGAAFDVFGDGAWAGCATLLLDRARVGGSLMLAHLKRPLLGASLVGAKVSALVDDASTWGGRLALDGFAYSRFADDAPTGAQFRLAWLSRQESAHLGRDFRPGPWRQLIAVLRRTGHGRVARDVAIARESHLRRIGRVGAEAPRPLRWLSRLGHWLFGVAAGYGYRPGRLVAAMAALWLVCGACYWAAAERGVMAPANPVVFDDPRYAQCRADAGAPRNGRADTGNWARCPDLPATYPPFRPFVYSLDVLLPGIDLQQEREWTALPSGAAGTADARPIDPWSTATRLIAWLELLCGWAASFVLVAAVLGLFERDR